MSRTWKDHPQAIREYKQFNYFLRKQSPKKRAFFFCPICELRFSVRVVEGQDENPPCPICKSDYADSQSVK